MQKDTAIALIQGGITPTDNPQQWADLGCGSGTFTRALADVLPAGSTIYAIDRATPAVALSDDSEIKIHNLHANFERDPLDLPSLQGILMANALHFVSDKASFIDRLGQYLHAASAFLIVEYNTMQSNPWVPYPIDYPHLVALFQSAGYRHIGQLATQPSLYQRGGLYSCVIRR